MPDFGLLPLRGREDSLSHEDFSAAHGIYVIPVRERPAFRQERFDIGGKWCYDTDTLLKAVTENDAFDSASEREDRG